MSSRSAAAWMLAALVVESTCLPHWLPVRWVPQVSLLILIFGALKEGPMAGCLLGTLLGLGHAVFSAMPAPQLIGIYAALGALAGAARRFVFLESPLTHWLVPAALSLAVEWAFFLAMPWDDRPLGPGDFFAAVRASNLPVTWLLCGLVYAGIEGRLFPRKKP